MKVLNTRRTGLIAFFTSLTAILAQITIYLPFTPIPITLQTLAVILSGIIGGALVGFLSQVIYIVFIMLGLPLAAGFKGGLVVLLGPTAGFLYGFPIASTLSGLIEFRGKSRFRLFLASMLGVFAVYPTGLLWLSLMYGVRDELAIIGLLPFIPGDIVKAIIASEIAYRVKKLNLLSENTEPPKPKYFSYSSS